MSTEFQLVLQAQALARLLSSETNSIPDACTSESFSFCYYYKCTSSQMDELANKLIKHWDWNLVAG